MFELKLHLIVILKCPSSYPYPQEKIKLIVIIKHDYFKAQHLTDNNLKKIGKKS